MKIVVLIIGAGLVTAFVAILVWFNIKRIHIIRCARQASNDQLESVYALLDSPVGAAEPVCAILGYTNKVAPSDSALIPIPSYIRPWGGKMLTIENKGKGEIHFGLIDGAVQQTQIAGKIWRIIPVLRIEAKSGKARNQFLPSRYIAKIPGLFDALARLCPKYPAGLLSYLLAAGHESFEFDEINQTRLGGSPAWVQDAEYPNCPECNKRMSLICQIPGTLLPRPKLSEGTFFFFGCATHPANTATVAQFS